MRTLSRSPWIASKQITKEKLMTKETAPMLKIVRTFDASRARIFDAWTNPKSDIGWWGPKDFTLLFHEIDLKPGGRHRMGMSRKGETEVATGVYREIDAPARLVMTHAWEDTDGKLSPETLITITLAERGGNTEMVFEQTGFEDAAMRDSHRGGWNEAFDALNASLKRAEAA